MANRVERKLVYLLIFGSVGAFLVYILAPVLTLFVLAALIAYVVNPLVTRLASTGVPRALIILLLLLLLVVSLVILALALVPMVRRELIGFSAHVPQYINWLHARLLALTHGRYTSDLHLLKDALLVQGQNLGAEAGRVLSMATYSGLHVLGWLARMFLLLVVTFYLLRDWDRLWQAVFELVPERYQARAKVLAREVDANLARLLRGQLSVMVSLMVIYSAGLSLAGLDLALPIGIIAGLISFIPYLGFFSGLFAAGLAALLQYHDLWRVLLVLVAFGIGGVMEPMILSPRLVGRSLGLHPALVIFAALTGAQLFGFVGILLALPTSAVLMVWFRHAHAHYRRSAWSR
ncbi:MAG: AI-2E family transporter [Gammaproteobacteria bacterium]|nr:AI-2E family transporter [Gammaproteobacteria bacterium]